MEKWGIPGIRLVEHDPMPSAASDDDEDVYDWWSEEEEGWSDSWTE